MLSFLVSYHLCSYLRTYVNISCIYIKKKIININYTANTPCHCTAIFRPALAAEGYLPLVQTRFGVISIN